MRLQVNFIIQISANEVHQYEIKSFVCTVQEVISCTSHKIKVYDAFSRMHFSNTILQNKWHQFAGSAYSTANDSLALHLNDCSVSGNLAVHNLLQMIRWHCISMAAASLPFANNNKHDK